MLSASTSPLHIERGARQKGVGKHAVGDALSVRRRLYRLVLLGKPYGNRTCLAKLDSSLMDQWAREVGHQFVRQVSPHSATWRPTRAREIWRARDVEEALAWYVEDEQTTVLRLCTAFGGSAHQAVARCHGS